MTDSRFCRKIIAEIQKNIVKTQQSLDLNNLERFGGIYIPYSAKTYARITRLIKELNLMCPETIYIELNDKTREIYVKFK